MHELTSLSARDVIWMGLATVLLWGSGGLFLSKTLSILFQRWADRAERPARNDLEHSDHLRAGGDPPESASEGHQSSGDR